MRIIAAKPHPSFRLELQFDSGKHGIVGLSGFAGHGVFAAWKHPGTFDQVTITPDGSIQWPGELDMCPDALTAPRHRIVTHPPIVPIVRTD